MVLEMFAYTTDSCIPDVDFVEPEDSDEIGNWYQHPNLHGWMERLYRSKGGTDPYFNDAPVKLTLEDIDALEQAVLKNELPHTTGEHFGESTADHKWQDLEFIAMARVRLADGESAYYVTRW